MVTGVGGIDLDRLAGWMDDIGLPPGAIIEAEELGGGSQNLMLRFSRGGVTYVLRHPPRHKRPESDDIMRRESQILAALATTDVPHPRLVAACTDTDVLGSAFHLTEWVDGTNPTIGLPERYRDDRSWRYRLGLAMSDGAAAIGALDPTSLGLADLGTPDGFLARQVERWRSQLESYSTFDGYPSHQLPAVGPVADWLGRNMPTSWQPGLIHGDYHFANVLCRTDAAELAAIVDWELSTVGDPLLDLGWLIATWPDPGEGDAPVPILRLDPWDGFPSRADLIGHYAERSDRDLSAIDWYEVVACYKLAIILEGTHARACAGKAPVAVGEQLHANALALLRRAADRIARS